MRLTDIVIRKTWPLAEIDALRCARQILQGALARGEWDQAKRITTAQRISRMAGAELASKDAAVPAEPGRWLRVGLCNLTSVAPGAKTLTANYPRTAQYAASSDTDADQPSLPATTARFTTDAPDPSTR